MEKYSHGAFNVTGRVVHIPQQHEAMPIIMAAWKNWFFEKQGAQVVGQAHPSMHAVYYNYVHTENHAETGYDMLVGVMTETDAVQTDETLTTITVPAQDYRYMTVEGGFPDSIGAAWGTINAISSEELPRTYGYDLEMYSEDGKKCTIAVSVKE